jgi:molybdenum cofactor cytidylyltransferase
MRDRADCGLILLAAGGSSRMGSPKQLLRYRGEPLIRRAARIALGSALRPVIAVLGAHAERIRPLLADLPVDVVVNARWAEGVGTSIRAGVELARSHGLAGVVLALADQVRVTAEMFDRLLAAQRESGLPIAASRYGGTMGVPALFAREMFPRLLALAPDQGCKGLILAHAARAVHVDCPEAEADVDTPEDYSALTS